METLAGKVAVVTGGGSGIGLATATRLADAGVLGGGGRPRRDGGRAGGGRARGARACRPTSGRSDEWPGIVDAVTSPLRWHRPGPPQRRGDHRRGRHHQVTDEIYRRAVGVNVDGVVFGVRALVPAMADRGGGAIVATASLAGLIGFSPDPIYCLTKHAVVGLVRSLVPQLAEHHITINAVCPSIVDTPLIDDIREVARGQRLPAHRPGGGVRGGGRAAGRARRPARPWSSRPGGRRCPSASPVPRVRGPGGRSGRCRRPEFAAHDQG